MNIQPHQLDRLYDRLRSHPAVTHQLFTRLQTRPYDTRGWSIFCAQHHHVVKAFPNYVRTLLNRLSDDQKTILSPVLDDELAEGAVHEELQSKLARELGVTDFGVPSRGVLDHIVWHTAVLSDQPIPYALGVLGPGHEAIIPTIFRRLISGSPPSATPSYLYAHLEQDPEHDRRFREVIYAYDQSHLPMVEQGAFSSLAHRNTMWTSILSQIDENL